MRWVNHRVFLKYKSIFLNYITFCRLRVILLILLYDIIIYLISASNEAFLIKQYLQQLFLFYPVYLVSLLNHMNCVVTMVTCVRGCVSTWVEVLRGLRRLRGSKYFLRGLSFFSFIQSVFIYPILNQSY